MCFSMIFRPFVFSAICPLSQMFLRPFVYSVICLSVICLFGQMCFSHMSFWSYVLRPYDRSAICLSAICSTIREHRYDLGLLAGASLLKAGTEKSLHDGKNNIDGLNENFLRYIYFSKEE